jgi:hypothetical protein
MPGSTSSRFLLRTMPSCTRSCGLRGFPIRRNRCELPSPVRRLEQERRQPEIASGEPRAAGFATARARFTSPFAVRDERQNARRSCRHGPHATGPVRESSMHHQECDRVTGAFTAHAPAARCHTPALVIYTDVAPDAQTDAGGAAIRELEHPVPSRRA